MKNIGTYIADKLDQSNETRKRITKALSIYTELSCLTIALLESGFWSKIFGEKYTWNGVFAYLSMEQSGLRADPLTGLTVATFTSFDSDLPIPEGSGPEDIFITFVTGLIIFLFLKVVLKAAYRKMGINL